MFVSPYSHIGAIGADITLGWPGTTTNTAGIPAAPQGFYIPPGFKHLFYTDNGSARGESSALLLRAASPGVGWLPDVVPQLKARVGDSAVDMTGTRMHLLRLVQAWGDKGLFTVLIAQGGMSPQYGSYPDLDSMTFEAFPPSALPNIKNQPGVFIVGLPNNEPSTAAAWNKYAALTGTSTGSTPGGGGVVLPTPKCPPKGVYNGSTCDCKALGPTAVFDSVSFLCVDCGPNTTWYVQGSKECNCLPGFVPYGTEGGGCVPATGVVIPGGGKLPVPTTPPPVIASGNPLSDWWDSLDDHKKNLALATGLIGAGVVAWLVWHGNKRPRETSAEMTWKPQTPASRWERDMGHRYSGAGPRIDYRSNWARY